MLTLICLQFQFHKGTIKTAEGLELVEIAEGYFNSIKVRLKPLESSAELNKKLFQFHKGTIKTLRPSCSTCYRRYFNSIKVRLKQNSVPATPVVQQFQFHKGTIKTRYQVLVPIQILISIP